MAREKRTVRRPKYFWVRKSWRFFPDGTDAVDVDAEEPDVEVSDKEAVDGAIKDAGEKTFTREQFTGVLRDKQASDTARQQAQADAAAAREANEQLRKELEEARKPKDIELSEEDAQEPVTRGEALRDRNKLLKDIKDIVTTGRDQDRSATLAERRAADVENLKNTHTVKSMGEGLDANTVVNEGTAWLQANKPLLFKAALESPYAASELYDLALTFVPEIKKRYQAHHNATLAEKLDTSEDTPPSGGGSASEPGDLLHQLLTSTKTGAELERELELNP